MFFDGFGGHPKYDKDNFNIKNDFDFQLFLRAKGISSL